MSEEGFAPVIHAISRWDRDIRNALRKELRAAGTIVSEDARSRASARSKTIPGTIKTRTRIQSRQVQVEIRAGSAEVPIAGLFELGNRGKKPKGGAREFRHPVFGDKENWTHQKMYPYLRPAVYTKRREVTKRIRIAVNKANVGIRL